MNVNIESAFNANLELATDENPEKEYSELIKIATEWTIDEVTETICRVAENRKARHIEAVNLYHYV